MKKSGKKPANTPPAKTAEVPAVPDVPTLEAHPLAAFFPPLPNDARSRLRRDIKANGQREPIMLFEGKILDGLNRYAACVELQVAPATTEFQGTLAEARAYVLSRNLFRRHMNKCQLAYLATQLATLEWGQKKVKGDARPVMTVDEAAAEVGVSEKYIKLARYVLRSGNDEDRARLRRGYDPASSHRGEAKPINLKQLANEVRARIERAEREAKHAAEVLAQEKARKKAERDAKRRGELPPDAIPVGDETGTFTPLPPTCDVPPPMTADDDFTDDDTPDDDDTPRNREYACKCDKLLNAPIVHHDLPRLRCDDCGHYAEALGE